MLKSLTCRKKPGDVKVLRAGIPTIKTAAALARHHFSDLLKAPDIDQSIVRLRVLNNPPAGEPNSCQYLLFQLNSVPAW